MARVEGFEPPTAWFVARYSIQLSYTRAVNLIVDVFEHRLVRNQVSIQCVVHHELHTRGNLYLTLVELALLCRTVDDSTVTLGPFEISIASSIK